MISYQSSCKVGLTFASSASVNIGPPINYSDVRGKSAFLRLLNYVHRSYELRMVLDQKLITAKGWLRSNVVRLRGKGRPITQNERLVIVEADFSLQEALMSRREIQSQQYWMTSFVTISR